MAWRGIQSSHVQTPLVGAALIGPYQIWLRTGSKLT